MFTLTAIFAGLYLYYYVLFSIRADQCIDYSKHKYEKKILIYEMGTRFASMIHTILLAIFAYFIIQEQSFTEESDQDKIQNLFLASSHISLGYFIADLL